MVNTKSAKMGALRSLTFTTIPKIVANPTLDRRTNTRTFGGAKTSAERSQLHTDYADLGENER